MSAVSFHKLHILIVDDFENFRSTLYKMLMDIGIGNVDSAHNGEDALRYCRSRSYDVILCDYNLGKGKTGQQVLEDLRIGKTLCTDSLFILVSAETSRSIVMAAYDFEPDAYLTKPITTKVLEQRLVRLLAQRQALLPISKAVKAKNFIEAEKLCLAEIGKGSRYSVSCQKILGNLYLEHNQLPKGEKLFNDVLAIRELEWAQLGMAKIRLQQGDYIGAQKWVSDVLQVNHLSMKAYDLQVEIYKALGQKKALQDTLQQAVELSPMAILRQQNLGMVAKENRDFKVACDAFKQSVKIGENSSYDRADIHIQFSQAVIELYSFDKEAAKPLMRDALKSVLNVENKFSSSSDDVLQANFLASQLYACAGDEARAKNQFEMGRKRLAASAAKSIAVEIEMIRTMQRLGQNEEAKKLLFELSLKYQQDEASLELLDAIQDEPQSQKNKRMVAEINKKGISIYNEKNYHLAAQAFQSALKTLPHHVGLRLNCAQALLDELKQSFDKVTSDLLWEMLSKVEDLITHRHEQFARYRQLREGFENLLREQEKPH